MSLLPFKMPDTYCKNTPGILQRTTDNKWASQCFTALFFQHYLLKGGEKLTYKIQEVDKTYTVVQ